MLSHVALVRTDISEKRIVAVIIVTGIGELGTTLAVTAYIAFLCRMHQSLATANVVPNSLDLVFLIMDALRSSETSVLTRATLRNISEVAILHSHSRENLNSYK
jgi:hypothetical protein